MRSVKSQVHVLFTSLRFKDHTISTPFKPRLVVILKTTFKIVKCTLTDLPRALSS
jgi:hypothetical protein